MSQACLNFHTKFGAIHLLVLEKNADKQTNKLFSNFSMIIHFALSKTHDQASLFMACAKNTINSLFMAWLKKLFMVFMALYLF